MITRALFAAALLLGFSNADAFRVLEPLETSVEVSLGNLTLPASATGTVSFRPCAECPIATHRMGDRPQFLLSRKPVTFEELIDYATVVQENRTARDATLATVFLDINTQRVTRIAIIRRSTP